MKLNRCILPLVIALLPCVVSGQGISVPGDYSKIQDAIDASSEYGVIYIGPGEFNENLYIDKSLYIYGSGHEATVINGGGNSDVIVASGAYDFLIEGLSVVNSGGTQDSAGLKLINCNYAMVYECRFSGNSNGVISSGEYSMTVIERCLVENNGAGGGCGLNLAGMDTDVTSCIIANNTGDGVCMSGVDGVSGFINNTVHDNSGFGLKCDASTPTVQNNIITYNGTGVYGVNGALVQCYYNNVWNSGANDYDSSSGGMVMPDQTDISEDPQYKNFVAGDFRLNALSPCVNSGDPDPMYNDPDSSRNDMGAYGGGAMKTDTEKPAAVTSLYAVEKGTSAEVILSWDTPGDDGWNGMVESDRLYVLKYADSPQNWSIPGPEGNMVVISTSGNVPGTPVTKMFSGLTAGVTYYFRIWASDDEYNWSEISNGATVWMYSDQQAEIYSMSGRITDSGGNGISSVTVAYSGERAGSVYTDSRGFYSVLDLPPGDYAFTPSKAGWAFTPSGRNYTPLSDDMLNQDYTGTDSSSGTEEEEIDVPIGDGGASVKVILPEAGESKLVMPESAKDLRGAVNPTRGDEVAIVFRSSSQPDEYVGRKFTIRFYILLGELLEELEKTPSSADDTWMTWIPQDIASGIYIIHVEGPGVSFQKKIPIIR